MASRKSLIPKIRHFTGENLQSFVIRHEARTRIGRIRQRLFRAILINRLTSGVNYLTVPPVREMARVFRCPELIVHNALLELKQDGYRVFVLDRERPIILYDTPSSLSDAVHPDRFIC